jgi:hypothetical protein
MKKRVADTLRDTIVFALFVFSLFALLDFSGFHHLRWYALGALVLLYAFIKAGFRRLAKSDH